MVDLLDLELGAAAAQASVEGALGADPWAPIQRSGGAGADPWSGSSSTVTSPQDPWVGGAVGGAAAVVAGKPIVQIFLFGLVLININLRNLKSKFYF